MEKFIFKTNDKQIKVNEDMITLCTPLYTIKGVVTEAILDFLIKEGHVEKVVVEEIPDNLSYYIKILEKQGISIKAIDNIMSSYPSVALSLFLKVISKEFDRINKDNVLDNDVVYFISSNTGEIVFAPSENIKNEEVSLFRSRDDAEKACYIVRNILDSIFSVKEDNE